MRRSAKPAPAVTKEQIDERMPVGDILARMREALGVKNDAELSRSIKVSQTAISSWKRRGAVPLVKCLEISQRTTRPLEWFLHGDSAREKKSSSDVFDLVELVTKPDQEGVLISTDRVKKLPVLAKLQRDLSEIAEDQSRSPAERDRADWFNIIAFADPAAIARHREKLDQIESHLKTINEAYESVESEIGWRPPGHLREAIILAMRLRQFDRSAWRDLLEAIRKAVEAGERGETIPKRRGAVTQAAKAE